VNFYLSKIKTEKDFTELHSMFITTQKFQKFKVDLIRHAPMMKELPNILTFLKLEINLKSPETTLGLHAVIELVNHII